MERSVDPLRTLLATSPTWAALPARLMLGLVIFPHGAQKLFGWFGGKGLLGTLDAFAPLLPETVMVLVILAESAGALLVIVGAGTRLAAGSIGLVMLGAIGLFHRHHFFMTWYGEPRPEGFEYHLLALGLVAVLLVTGGGRASVDRLLVRRLERREVGAVA